jgi:hypothetical protein
MMKRINFVLTAILVILASFGCSSGSSAVTPDPGDNYYPITAADATINGRIQSGGTDLIDADAFLFDLSDGSLFAQTNANNLGIAQFGVTEGQYMLLAFTDTLYAEPVIVNSLTDSVIDFTIELNKPLLSTKALYFGFVTNEDNDTPVPLVKVSHGEDEIYTDGYGFYLLSTDTDADKLTAEQPGFKTKEINLREGAYADRNDYYTFLFFPLKPLQTGGTTLRGYIRDASFGHELGGAFVSLLSIQNPSQKIVTYMTNIDGRYSFYNLPSAQYSVAVRRDGYEAESNQVIINENEAIFNIYLNPDFNERGSLSGYVITPEGNGIANTQVIVTNPLLGKYQTWTDPGTGFYFIDQIVPGDYTILVLPPGTMYEPATTFVTMIGNDITVNITCSSPLTGVLTGIVSVAGQDPEALPPTGAKVVAEKIGSPFSGLTWTTHVDPTGRYTINGIYTGMYRIVASLDYDDEVHYEGSVDGVQIIKGVVKTTDIVMDLS